MNAPTIWRPNPIGLPSVRRLLVSHVTSISIRSVIGRVKEIRLSSVSLETMPGPTSLTRGRSEAIRERAVVAIAGVEARPDSKGKVDVREA